MDPNAALEDLKRLAAAILVDEDLSDVEDLAETVIALDSWLSKGGFLPHDWRKARSTSL